MGNANTNVRWPCWAKLWTNANTYVGSHTIGGEECLNVYVSGGDAVPVYTDDSGEFVTATSKGQAIMAKYFAPDDDVDDNDIGILSMTQDRKLRVDATVGALGLQSEHVDDAGFTVDGDYGQAVGGIATGDQVHGTDFGVFAMTTHREQRVALSHNGWEVSVRPTWLNAGEDETATSLAVGAGCYGYYGAGAVNGRMRPLLMDLDDDAVARNQIPQLVMNENHYYDTGTDLWKRWNGSVVVSNLPASQTVDDGGGILTVDGTVSVDTGAVPSTHDPETLKKSLEGLFK